MATNVVALTQPGNAIDTYGDIKNTLAAREALQRLLATLATRRQDAMNAFLRAFAAEFATASGAPDKGLVNIQLPKFTAQKSADDELAKRIDALNAIRIGLEGRIGEFAKAHRDEVIELLTQQIAALKQQPQELWSDQDALNQWIAMLQDELDQLRGSAAKPRAGERKRKK
jgi:hypothetical protein